MDERMLVASSAVANWDEEAKNDLEILENLKETIKRPTRFLQGPSTASSATKYLSCPSKVPHPEQANGSRDIDQARNADPVSPSRAPTISSSIAHMAVDNVNGPQSAGVKSEPDLHLPVDSKPPVTRRDTIPRRISTLHQQIQNSVSSADGVAPGSDNMAISVLLLYYDPRDRDRDREFRERDNYRDRDWERERDRYRYGRDDPRRLSDARRPDARHYEPEYDPHDRLPPPPRRDDRVDRPYPDERSFARPPLLSDVRPPGPDSRPVADPRDSRDGRAAPNSSAHGPAMDNRTTTFRKPRYSTNSTYATSATSTEEKSSPIRPPPALEERIGRTPTLQERLNAPPVRPENNGRQPTLEERISQAPVTANQSTGILDPLLPLHLQTAIDQQLDQQMGLSMGVQTLEMPLVRWANLQPQMIVLLAHYLQEKNVDAQWTEFHFEVLPQ
ncbi:hypothetical protein D9758_018461 [Tetrapyrgos nigripes]|uniref:Uncharacterized protein n=1 Tax=Tetrapyrgos nigripes TaxID=182062 RepID=A0A8H5C0G9_9AGAR|nr:hypothetical protein D9758_018461 [Tetrapyrgos nigripes]